MNQTLLFIIYGAAGAIATYFLQKVGLTAVIASCLIGLVGALLGYLLKSPDVAAVVFIGSFVGMTSLSIGSIPMMLLGGAVSGIVYNLTQSYFVGHGGRMGSIAFISLLISMAIFYLIELLVKVLK